MNMKMASLTFVVVAGVCAVSIPVILLQLRRQTASDDDDGDDDVNAPVLSVD